MKEDNIEQQHTEETPEKNRIIAWVKEHKSQLLLAGVSITTVFLTVMGIKNKGEIDWLETKIKEYIDYIDYTYVYEGDSHYIEDIGQRNTWIKIRNINFSTFFKAVSKY